jgi:TRAP-type mannitol/chloroaromatic compound transport system substrate-binding protein
MRDNTQKKKNESVWGNNRERFMRFTSWLTATVCAGLVAISAVSAQERKVRFNMPSAYPGSLTLLGDAAHRFTKDVSRLTNGTLEIKFHEPGALVPALQAIEAVSQGSAEMAYSAPGFFAKADTAFIIFSSLPFGPAIPEYMAWVFKGGGLELSREMFAKHNVVNIPCNIIPPESSGWFRKEITSVDDLKGMKMRFFGLGAKVMEKLGVATQLLAPGDIFQALQLGTIDATEFSLPQMDQKFGFYQVAKFYYFPGWHQQASWQEVYVNKAKWDALSDQHKAAIEMSCAKMLQDVIAEGEASQFKALAEMRDKHGVQIKTWPPEILEAIQKAWKEVAEEESAKNPNFKRVFDHYTEFRRNYAIWKEIGYLK